MKNEGKYYKVMVECEIPDARTGNPILRPDGKAPHYIRLGYYTDRVAGDLHKDLSIQDRLWKHIKARMTNWGYLPVRMYEPVELESAPNPCDVVIDYTV